MSKKVELISVGNELLIGKTLNTNAQWLSKRITSLGLSISRITVVGDLVEEISRILQEALSRSPHFIIVTGGLGPTFDDQTLEGVAQALDTTLAVDDTALRMVEQKYRAYAEELGREEVKLTSARVKMATIPKGAKPIPNPVGTAPAILIKSGNVDIYALPGVPSEMKAIFEHTLVKDLKECAGQVTFFEASLFVSHIMESAIAPLIDRVMHNNPYVYIKSHPMGDERSPRIELHLSTTADNEETARKRVKRTLMELSEVVKENGGNIRPQKQPD
jgi:nicotinamide-nucleotide amidase